MCGRLNKRVRGERVGSEACMSRYSAACVKRARSTARPSRTAATVHDRGSAREDDRDGGKGVRRRRRLRAAQPNAKRGLVT